MVGLVILFLLKKHLLFLIFPALLINSITPEEIIKIESSLTSVFKHQPNNNTSFPEIELTNFANPIFAVSSEKTNNDFISEGLWLAKQANISNELTKFKENFLKNKEKNKHIKLKIEEKPVKKIIKLDDGFFLQTKTNGFFFQAKNPMDLVNTTKEKSLNITKKMPLPLDDYLFLRAAGTTTNCFFLGLKKNLTFDLSFANEKIGFKKIPISFHLSNGVVDKNGNFLIQDLVFSEVFLGKTPDVLLNEDYLVGLFSKEPIPEHVDFIKKNESVLLSQKKILEEFWNQPRSNINDPFIPACNTFFQNFEFLTKINPQTLLNLDPCNEFISFLDLIEKIKNKIFQEIKNLEKQTENKTINPKITQKEFYVVLVKIKWFLENVNNFFKENLSSQNFTNTKPASNQLENSFFSPTFLKMATDKFNQISQDVTKKINECLEIDKSIQDEQNYLKKKLEDSLKECSEDFEKTEKNTLNKKIITLSNKLSEILSQLNEKKDVLNFYATEIKLNLNLLNQDKNMEIPEEDAQNLNKKTFELLEEKMSFLTLEKNILIKISNIKNKLNKRTKEKASTNNTTTSTSKLSDDLVKKFKQFFPLEQSLASFLQNESFFFHDQLTTVLLATKEENIPNYSEQGRFITQTLNDLFEYLTKTQKNLLLLSETFSKKLNDSSTQLFLFFKSNLFTNADLNSSKIVLQEFTDLLSKNISTNLQILQILEKKFDLLLLYLISPLKKFNFWTNLATNQTLESLQKIIKDLLTEYQNYLDILASNQNQSNLLKQQLSETHSNIIEDLTNLTKANNNKFFSELKIKEGSFNKIYFYSQFSFLQSNDQIEIKKNILDQQIGKKNYWQKITPYFSEIETTITLVENVKKIAKSLDENIAKESLAIEILKKDENPSSKEKSELINICQAIVSNFKKYQETNFSGIEKSNLEDFNPKEFSEKIENLINFLKNN